MKLVVNGARRAARPIADPDRASGSRRFGGRGWGGALLTATVVAGMVLPAGQAVAAAQAPASASAPVAGQAFAAVDESGVTLRVFDTGRLTSLCTLKPAQTPNVDKLMSTINYSTDADWGMTNNFTAQVLGNIQAATAGSYTFRLTSDDGSRMSINGVQIINHDGLHGDTSMDGTVTLTAGTHPFNIDYFDAGGGKILKLQWRIPGSGTFVDVPAAALSTEAGVTRVTAPGFKECEGATDVPGNGLPLTSVNPNYTVTNLRPEGFQPQVTGIDWLPDGRMVIITWGGNNGDLGDNKGEAYILDHVTGATGPAQVTYKKIADTLREPQGIKVVDGEIYISEKDKLVKLVDSNGDEVADSKQTIATWPYSANFHEFAFGILYKDGFFYINLSVGINLGGATTNPQPSANRGTTMKINKDTGAIQYVAGGLRTPHGSGWGPEGGMFVTDNQGAWLPANKLIEIKQDQFNGHYMNPPGPFDDKTPTPPVLWIPQNDIGNSPSTPLWIESGPYANQMYIADVTYGGIQRGFLEKVGGAYQGAIFRMTQGLESGISRLSLGPDGDIYAGGLGAGGNWGQEGKLRWGLQKLTPVAGSNVFDFLSMSVNEDGFELKYTQPLSDETVAGIASRYEVKSWSYLPTQNYGGPKIGEKTLQVTGATVSADKKTVQIDVDGRKPGTVVYIRTPRPFTSADGANLWNAEAWYTLNSLPGYVEPPTDGGLLEVEGGTLAGGTGIGSEHAGFTGAGYAEFQNIGNTSTVQAYAGAAAEYKMTIRYANGPNPFAGPKKISLYVNGVKKQITLPSTGTWKTWGTVVETVSLNTGTNPVAFSFETGDDGNVNIDSINLYRSPVGDTVEAEDADYTGGTDVQTEHAGFSGTGFIAGFTAVGAAVSFPVHVDAAGTYPTTLRYSAGPNPFAGPKKVTIYVNGTKIKQATVAATSTWKIWSDHVENLTLTAGLNTITYKYDTGDDGNINIDALRINRNAGNCGTGAVVANDNFDGSSLDRCRWTRILNEVAADVSVSDGALRIKAAGGDIASANPNAKNVVLQKAPAGAWSIKTKVSITGTDDYLQAGLVAYESQTDYAKTVLINVPGQGWRVELGRTSGSTNGYVQSANLPTGANENIWLRMDSKGGLIRGFYSLDAGTTWNQVGNGMTAGGIDDAWVGLAGYNGTGAEVAVFDQFLIGEPEPITDTCSATAPQAGYTSLFDGTVASTEKWTMAGPGAFVRENDCTLLTTGGLGLFWYNAKSFTDYSLKLDWKMQGDDNAGVFIGFPDPGTDPWVAVDHGYEIQIDATDAADRTTGAIYTFQSADVALRDSVLKPPGQWNSYEIRVVGNLITIALNGTVINTYTNPAGSGRTLANSYIGLQNHGDGDDVWFRNVQIRELAAPMVSAVTTPAVANGNNGWFTGPVSVAVTAEADGFGASLVEAKVDDGAWAAVTGPLTVTGDGTHTVQYRGTRDGKVSQVQQQVIKIDGTTPVTAPDVAGGTQVMVALAAADATSGVASTSYRIGTGEWTTYSAPFAVTPTATATTVSFRSTDRAGNVEAIRSVTVPGTAAPERAVSTTTVTTATPAVTAGSPTAVTVSVARTGSVGTIGADLVTIYANGDLVASGRLAGGTVTVPVVLPVGTHMITAEYVGNATVAPSVSEEISASAYFADKAPGSTFYDEVMWLAGSGITSGQTATTFAPGLSVSRQAMAAFLFRLENPGAPKPTCTTAPFTDVAVSAEFCGEIAWLKSTGITTGQDGKFNPGTAVQRQAMAAFLFRLENPGAPKPTCTTAPFTDVAVSAEFCGEIAWLKSTGITTGANGKFNPGAAVERQAMAAFLYRLTHPTVG